MTVPRPSTPRLSDLGIDDRGTGCLWINRRIRSHRCCRNRNYIERVFERRRHAGSMVATAKAMTGTAATAFNTA